MTYFTDEQVKLLLARIHPNRVLARQGMSYVEGYDIRAELTRIFGFGRWSSEVLDQAVICDAEKKTNAGNAAWYVVYRSRVRLTIYAPDGTLVTFHDGSHVGESTHPVRGEAHGNALTNSETYALRRAAINLGDQFGLSLYNKGSMDPLVRWTLVHAETQQAKADTDDVPKVAAEESGSSSASSDEEQGGDLTPEQIRDEMLKPATTPERIRELLIIADGDYPDVVLVNGSGDDERLVEQLQRAFDERSPAPAKPQQQVAAAPAQDGDGGEEQWVRDFYERLADSGPGDIRARRVEVMTATSAKLITAATANDLMAALAKRKAEAEGREAA